MKKVMATGTFDILHPDMAFILKNQKNLVEKMLNFMLLWRVIQQLKGERES